MKKISLLFAFVAFFGAASFANTSELNTASLKVDNSVILTSNATNSDIDNALEAYFKKRSCTVKATWSNGSGGTVNLTATNTCDNCTQQQACDGAYALLSILIPG
jgi:hypothetical protein